MSDLPKTIGDLGEDKLIEIFAEDAASLGSRVIVPNGDDAAAFVVDPKFAMVITTDTLVEGVHFDLSYCSPLRVGRKLMAVNLSDVAAMGARARYVLLSICFPRKTPIETARGIALGIREQCRTHGVAIIGGNTTRIDGPIVLTATLLGRVEPDDIIRRRGTQNEDAIYVTGRLGDANAGLRMVQSRKAASSGDAPFYPLFSALVDPVPRVEAGRALAKSKVVHAMCDVSDGLGRDLQRLLKPEGLGARIEGQLLPISSAMRTFAEENGLSAEELAVEGGEDYELLFTADPHHEKEIIAALANVATPVTRIGTVIVRQEIEIFLSDGTVISPPEGFDHFGGKH
jgi:thiamine-monophosphate kinase